MIRWMFGGVVQCGLCPRFFTGRWRVDIGLWMTLLLMMSHDAVVYALFPFVGYEPRPIIQDRPGCYMDGTFRSFGDRWSPILEPQGLMVCVKCQCLAVEKKGILQTKGDIMCRNIKDLCPEPGCEHPVLRVGKCCKSCPGSDDFESTFTLRKGGTLSNDVYALDDRTLYEAQEFRALLVGRQVLAGPVKTRAVAVAYIQVAKGRIQFALRYSRLERPRSFILQDIHGSVLFEKSIRRDVAGDKKVCGVWTKIPGFYLKYFRQEKLYATVTTSRYPHGIVSGKITPKSPANKETFSAILTSARSDGSGGHLLADYAPETRLLTYATSLDGIRGSWKTGNFHVAVMKGSSVVYQTGGSMVATTGIISGSWRLSKRHRKQIARGRLHVRVTFLDLPSLEGIIQPRLTCSVFQAVLSSSHTADSKRTYSSGSAVLRLGEDGSLEYSIQLSGLTGNVTRIRLEGAASKYEYGPKLVGNLFKSDSPTQQFPVSEWTNGTYRKLEADDVFRLLNNQLSVNIATTRHRISQLRGRLVTFQYNEHFMHRAVPASLVPVSDPGRGGAAHVWLSLDAECVLRFDAAVAGAQRRPGAVDVLLGSHSNQQRVFVLKQQAAKMGKVASSYSYAAGEVTNIPDDLLLALDRGEAFVQINAHSNGLAVFRGNLTLPNSCWRFSNDVDTDYAEEDQTEFTSSDQDQAPVCNFEGQIYEDGSMWLPDVSADCTTCSCVAGKTMCQRMICPALTCRTPVTRSGDCCPSCPYENELETCFFGKDPRKYRAHSTWHPYLPLDGFTKCAVCRCFPGGRVECNKSPCPVLHCPKSQWVKGQTDPCCYECRLAIATVEPDEEPQGDQNVNGVCTFLEATKASGETWHPTIQPFGHMKCFLCECQDGAVSCGRVKCPELKCSTKVRQAGQCCEECLPNVDTSPVTAADQVGLRTNGTSTNKGCKFGNKQYRNRQRWQPISSPTGSGECAVCQCREGSVKCRLRCPRVCRQDLSQDPCCRHCSEKVKTKARNRSPVTATSSNSQQTTPVPQTSPPKKARPEPQTSPPQKARPQPGHVREQREGQEQERRSKKPGLIDRSDFLTMFS